MTFAVTSSAMSAITGRSFSTATIAFCLVAKCGLAGFTAWQSEEPIRMHSISIVVWPLLEIKQGLGQTAVDYTVSNQFHTGTPSRFEIPHSGQSVHIGKACPQRLHSEGRPGFGTPRLNDSLVAQAPVRNLNRLRR